MAFTSAFAQIRLSGQLVSSTTDSRLKVGSATTMMASDSGAFTSSAVVVNTGQALYNLITGLSGVENTTIGSLSGYAASAINVTNTGATLLTAISNLSGYSNSNFLTKGSNLSFISGLLSGVDTYYINFPTGFATKPRVECTLEVASSFIYNYNLSQVSNTGFFIFVSDTIAETGVSAHIDARL